MDAANVDFPKDLKGLNDNEWDNDINQNLQSLSMYHHLCLFFQAIQQNHFILLKLLKRELQSKKWRNKFY